MSESLNCDLCGKHATVHLTQIINNKVQKVDLCEDCAEKKGLSDPEGFSLAEMLSKNFGELAGAEHDSASGDELHCPVCGYQPIDFKKTGRLGCPDCYHHLAPLVLPMLARLHRGNRHCGKVPDHLKSRLEYQRSVEDLDEKLQAAISDERYEDAATFRDKIEQLKASQEAVSDSVGKSS